MKKRILVTGGAGYFGQLLMNRLQELGHSVYCFDLNRPEGLAEEFIRRGDITNESDILKATEGMDYVFHNVAQVPLAKDKELFFRVNEGGTQNMLSAAKAHGVKKIIYTSSSAVFGIPSENPVKETTIPHPMEDYGLAKLKGEQLVLDFSAETGIDVAIIRPRTILGLGRLGIFQILFEWIYQGYNVPVFGRGDNIYQFVHAADLAEACILSADKSGAHVYNCGTDRYGSMRQMLEALCKHAGTGSRVVSVPQGPTEFLMKLVSAMGLSPLGPYHAMMYGRSMYFDITKAQTELGWAPKYSNDEMIIESYNWYAKNRSSILSAKNQSHHRSPVKEQGLVVVKHLLSVF